MQSAEIELKFPVVSLPALVGRLAELGFLVETPRTFEQNTLHDTPERSLRERGELLRVRRYGARELVTHKRHPEEEDTESPYKVRIETESEVGDGEAMAEIFCRLGFCPAFRYEKYRTEYTDPREAGGHVVVDETPIGIWAELEGPTEWIDRTLLALGVDAGTCLTESYGKLFLAWKRRMGSAVEHMTFAEIEAEAAARELVTQ